MSPVLYSLLAILVIFIGIIIWSVRENSEGWTIASIVIAIFIAIFGFGLYGTVSTWNYEPQNAKVYEVIKGKHVVVVSTDNGNIIFDGYKVEDINDSTKFYWKVGFNHYNYEISRTLIYK